MESKYKANEVEEKIYAEWEKEGYFKPKIDQNKKPFTIILPPPNANAPLHLGHALFVVEDILCRWHRMKGEPTLFLPGTDHAGIETQYVFEKKLKEKNQSRFDFDRETLYKMIDDYVEENRGIAKNQLKKLGLSLDWSREKYTLNPEILKTVLATFKKLHQDGLIYRGKKLVNYCPSCGTAFSDLEINHVEKDDFLYYLDYGLIQIATTRPETIFADAAVAVNPEDKRYQKLVGQKAILPILEKELPIISDELVDKEFGTGALKITPGHDTIDFEIGQKHHLGIISTIDKNARMINVPLKYLGMTLWQARKAIVNDLEELGKLVKVEPLKHIVSICYRCKNLIEPLIMPQWFIKIEPLARPAMAAVKENRLEIFPPRFKKFYLRWLENVKDWNISRQVVWGPRIPAWYCLDCNPEIIINFINQKGTIVSGIYKELKEKYSFQEIKKGLQSLFAPEDAIYFLEESPCQKCQSKNVLQETDTFDTWFSSGQWPLTTLGYPNSKDFKYFYPTSVLDTMWDILFFWVARMVMFGLYLTGEIPFKVAHMHSRVVDKKGQKMSKSKDNVIDPMEAIEKYGSDSLRMSLVFGIAPGSDICLGEEKLKAMRNFCNKIWNAGRFLYLSAEKQNWKIDFKREKSEKDKKMLEKAQKMVNSVTKALEKYRFGQASEEIYQFFWHEFCDVCLEECKEKIDESLPTLIEIYAICLKVVHPFAPFVSEAAYKVFREKFKKTELFSAESLIIAPWPQDNH